MGDLVFLSCQPSHGKFVWQLEVQMLNFKELGIEEGQCWCVMVDQGKTDGAYSALKRRYPKVHWVEMKDERESKHYIPSIRPWGFARLFALLPPLRSRNIFYYDSDIIFRALPNFAGMDDGRVHVSDTVSYLGYEYIMKFGERYLDAMCEVVGIDKEEVRSRQAVSGSCQYFFPKGFLTRAWWEKVYRDCEAMYVKLDAMVKEERQCPRESTLTRRDARGKSSVYTIQHWCTGMWCEMWNIWKSGIETVIDEELGFSWATSPIADWDKYKIYHDAGVTEALKGDYFHKGKYTHLPKALDKTGWRTDVCSVKYVEWVERAIRHLNSPHPQPPVRTGQALSTREGRKRGEN
jgi:hypothetical protein